MEFSSLLSLFWLLLVSCLLFFVLVQLIVQVVQAQLVIQVGHVVDVVVFSSLSPFFLFFFVSFDVGVCRYRTELKCDFVVAVC